MLKSFASICIACSSIIVTDVLSREPFSVPLSSTEYAAFLPEKDMAFVTFVRSNIRKTVRLQLRFAEPPYDYKGRTDLALWNAAKGGVFFECNGSWDTFNGSKRTGYASSGSISGEWDVVKSQIMSGYTYYTLKCR